MMQTTNMHQPSERRIKKILISAKCYHTRTTMWALVDAVKVGDHYQIPSTTIEDICNAVRGGNTGYLVRFG